MAIANSWILYREDRRIIGDSSKEVMKFLDFKLQVAHSLLVQADGPKCNNKNEAGKLRLTTRNNSTWYNTTPPTPAGQHMKHLPKLAKKKNSMRCKFANCIKKTKFYCETCEIHLCIKSENECFYKYHVNS